VAPEKVPLSDWYPTWTKSPPYKNNSYNPINIEFTVVWLGGILIRKNEVWLTGEASHMSHLGVKSKGLCKWGIPWPKISNGVKYQGFGWKGSKGRAWTINRSLLVRRGYTIFSSSPLVISSIIRRPGGRPVVIIVLLDETSRGVGVITTEGDSRS